VSPIDPALFKDRDGFSPGAASLFVLLGATAEGLPRIPHFVDLDGGGRSDEDTTMILRPVVRLADAHRYIVAVRHVKGRTERRSLRARRSLPCARGAAATRAAHHG